MRRGLKLQHRMGLEGVEICHVGGGRLALIGRHFAPQPSVTQQGVNRGSVKRRKHTVVLPKKHRPVGARPRVNGIGVLNETRIAG